MSRRGYRLQRELGTGTFGTVYEAEMLGPGGFRKKVALKVLHPEWEEHEEAAQRLRDEARLLGRLLHPHVVRVDGLVRVQGRWAVVMEYVPGQDVSVVVRALRVAARRFPVPAALEMGGAVASALHAAWTAPGDQGRPLQVIHRDIKPSNVRLTMEGEVKVLDFGIARARFAEREAVTGGTRFGSIPFMAPERRRQEGDTPEGDVYALGCVLFQCLTTHHFPSAYTDSRPHEVLVASGVQTLRETGHLGPEVVDLVASMLAFEPDARPRAGQVAERCRDLARRTWGDDLRAFCGAFLPLVHRYVEDRTRPVDSILSDESDTPWTSPPERALPAQFTEDPTGSYPEPPRERSRGRRHSLLLGGSAGAITFLVLVGLASFFLPDDPVEASVRLDEVVFEVPGARALRADCLGGGEQGLDVVHLHDVLSGPCRVEAVVGHVTQETVIQVSRPGVLRCEAEGAALRCEPR